jgi:hypothetical protein
LAGNFPWSRTSEKKDLYGGLEMENALEFGEMLGSPDPSPLDQFPQRVDVDSALFLSYLINLGHGKLTYFGPMDVAEILKIKPSPRLLEDHLAWAPEKHGIFTVKTKCIWIRHE